MAHTNTKKPEPWRIIVGILSVAFIVYMWIKEDILAIYATAPTEQIVPMIVTTLAVSLAKVAALAGGILLVKWLLRKFKNKQPS